MVVLDLLDFESSASVPSLDTKTASSGALGAFKRGDVVLAKYSNKSRFYWAKVKKTYKSSSGDSVVDVEWLRPQAGAPVGKLYVLHDGHDETCHGDGLSLSLSIRRPCADDLRDGAPPGAMASSSTLAYSKANDVSDLLGEPIVEKKVESECLLSQEASVSASAGMGSLFQSRPPLVSQVSGPMYTPTLGCQTGAGPSWQADFNSAPWPGASAPQAHPFMQNMPPTTPVGFSGFQPRPFPQQMQSSVKPAGPAARGASMNELQASFASDFLGRKEPPLNVNVAKGNREECFDFISDMMSGALTDVKHG